MRIKIKNPFFLYVLNWAILLILYQGIPLKTLDEGIDSIQAYLISFLCMSIDFFGNESNFYYLLISWILSITLFSIFSDVKFKIPIIAMLFQVFIFIFAVIFLRRYSPHIFDIILLDLIFGLFLSLAIISILFIPLFLQKKLQKGKKISVYPRQYEERSYIKQCPYCGTKYNSNPSICHVCSKKINN